jgi:hypothetical protein
VTTGWAFFSKNEVRATGEFLAEAIHDEFPRLYLLNPDARVISEYAVPVGLDRVSMTLRMVLEAVTKYFPKVEFVRPAAWKPITGKWPVPQGVKSQHAKDAIRLGYWAMRRDNNEA